MDAYIIKFEYDEFIGIGTSVVFAEDEDDAVDIFRKYMNESKNERWNNATFNACNFRFINKNIYNWHMYVNDRASVYVKVKHVDNKFGNVIPVSNNFEEVD